MNVARLVLGDNDPEFDNGFMYTSLDEVTYFEFLCSSSNRNTLHEKICIHEYASLYVEEI